MGRTILLTAVLSSLATALTLYAAGFASLPQEVKLENNRVRVVEVTYPPGEPRERGIRQTDQVIVFLNDCRYERKDSVSGEKTIRARKAGEVIWHNKGEDAPQLTNAGTEPYKTLVIELK